MKSRKKVIKSTAVNKKNSKKRKKLTQKQRSARKRKKERNVLYLRAWADKKSEDYAGRFGRDFKLPLRK